MSKIASPLASLFRRELSLAFGKGGGPLLACGFYAAVAVLLPLAEGPDPRRLAAVAPGAAFVALALASLLSLERLFERDYEDGALDLLALGEPGLVLASAVKCFALGARRGGVLVAVIVLPLFTPLVVFGAGAVDAFAAGMEIRAALALLSAYALFASALAPFAMAAACRNALS